MRARRVSSVLFLMLVTNAMAQDGRGLQPRADGRAVGLAQETEEPRGGEPVLRTEKFIAPGTQSPGAAEGAPLEGALPRQGIEQPGVPRGPEARQDPLPSETALASSAAPSTRAHSRGEYLVTRVALCVMCHSPRDEAGNLIQSRLLMGGKVPILPAYPDANWPHETPRLSGLPTGYDADALVRLLTKGIAADGETPRLPMPPFRMEEADARAIADYLASLGGKPAEVAMPEPVVDRSYSAGVPQGEEGATITHPESAHEADDREQGTGGGTRQEPGSEGGNDAMQRTLDPTGRRSGEGISGPHPGGD